MGFGPGRGRLQAPAPGAGRQCRAAEAGRPQPAGQTEDPAERAVVTPARTGGPVPVLSFPRRGRP